jgi:hypothetical protein
MTHAKPGTEFLYGDCAEAIEDDSYVQLGDSCIHLKVHSAPVFIEVVIVLVK